MGLGEAADARIRRTRQVSGEGELAGEGAPGEWRG